MSVPSVYLARYLVARRVGNLESSEITRHGLPFLFRKTKIKIKIVQSKFFFTNTFKLLNINATHKILQESFTQEPLMNYRSPHESIYKATASRDNDDVINGSLYNAFHTAGDLTGWQTSVKYVSACSPCFCFVSDVRLLCL
jgi:hypothetical protein